MKTIGFFAVLLLLLAAITSSPKANPVLAYVFEDTGASGWGQAGVGKYEVDRRDAAGEL